MNKKTDPGLAEPGAGSSLKEYIRLRNQMRCKDKYNNSSAYVPEWKKWDAYGSELIFIKEKANSKTEHY